MRAGNTTGGFSLIEVIVAMAIGLIVVSALAQTFMVSVRQIHVVRADTALANATAQLAQLLMYEGHLAHAVTVPDLAHAELMRADGTTKTLVWDTALEQLTFDGNTLMPDEVHVRAFTCERVGTTVHLTWTLAYESGVERTLTGQITVTPRI